MSKRSEAKTVFITGGASGLGRALAEAYAADGFNIAIGDVNDVRLAETQAALEGLGAKVLALRCDVTQEAHLVAARDAIMKQFGRVDIVVNNAGVAQSGPIDETSMEDWQWIVDINLLGVVRGCKVFTPVFKQQKSGTFINIASMAGLIHPPQMASYNATKAAVVALSETLKIELHPWNISVSVVCPAFFRTNLHETQRSTSAELDGFTRKLVAKAKVEPAEIAAKVKAGAARGDFHILTHEKERRIWLFKRYVPYPIYAKAAIREAQRVFARKPKTAAK
jgi:NAD(P)-dependent dehydrogenase (short-subunit alcohol dehydrogenase family)